MEPPPTRPASSKPSFRKELSEIEIESRIHEKLSLPLIARTRGTRTGSPFSPRSPARSPYRSPRDLSALCHSSRGVADSERTRANPQREHSRSPREVNSANPPREQTGIADLQLQFNNTW